MDPVEVLVVEDNPGDILLLEEALLGAGLAYRIRVVRNGEEATDYLLQQGEHRGAARPELIVLDLKLPRKNGREVLADILADPALSTIPLVILSSSRSELDAARSSGLPKGSYMTKPTTFQGYEDLVESIEAFRLKPQPHSS